MSKLGNEFEIGNLNCNLDEIKEKTIRFMRINYDKYYFKKISEKTGLDNVEF